MAGDIKTKYPQSNADTVALTITLASLAANSGLTVGQESTAVDNRTNLDEDHLLSGKIRAGAATGGRIEVWAYTALKIASGTPTYGATFPTGTNAAITFNSRGQMISAMALLWSTSVDAVTGRDYFMPAKSIRDAFGEVPAFWGAVLVHSTGAALDSTAANHWLEYERVQKQFTG